MENCIHTRCRNCLTPLTPQAIRDGADACSLRCVREFVMRGRGRSIRDARITERD